jgi:hypothetical protein
MEIWVPMVMDDKPRVWSRRRPINYPKQLEMTGGVAAPLLVGFSLVIVAQLVTGKDQPWLSEWAVALFTIAAVLLVYALQFSSMALGYAATPSDRLDYNPEAASEPDILRVVRTRQWEEMELRAKYTFRTKYCYNLGLLAFLCGLELIIVPRDSWPWPWGRFVGVAAVSVSIIIEVMWILFDAKRPRWLLPTSSPTTTPDSLPDEGTEYLFDRDRTDDIAGDLRRCVELLERIALSKPKGSPLRRIQDHVSHSGTEARRKTRS